MKKKRLIIVGGGFAGITLAKRASGKFDTLLVDKKSYFEFIPGIPEALVNKKMKASLQFPYEKLRNIKFINAEIKSFDNKKIILKNGRILYFDFLVLSTGSSYKNPIKESKNSIKFRLSGLEKYNKKISNSKSIAVIGGGIVGAEVAGEISSKFENKKIFLIQAGDTLVPRNNLKTQKIVKNILEKQGVNIRLNERFEKIFVKKIKTDNREYNVDLSIFCLGISPNTNFSDKKYLDEKGYFKVSSNLRLLNEKNIFVMGDATNVLEEKTAQSAIAHAKLVMKNLENILQERKLKDYNIQKRPLVIKMGKGAVLEMGSISITGIIPKLIKKIIEKKFMLFI
ncbi:MAG: FAD-dependent oxidoreductase [Bacteroidales bacterium]|nr:FAD-dependent oxidoreductase [Bacteroidales bacterium]